MVIPSGPLEAMACVKGKQGIQGTVKFYPAAAGTLVVTEILGLPQEQNAELLLQIEADRKKRGHEEGQQEAEEMPMVMRCCNGRAFLAAETDRFDAWDMAGCTVSCRTGADRRVIARGEVRRY